MKKIKSCKWCGWGLPDNFGICCMCLNGGTLSCAQYERIYSICLKQLKKGNVVRLKVEV